MLGQCPMGVGNQQLKRGSMLLTANNKNKAEQQQRQMNMRHDFLRSDLQELRWLTVSVDDGLAKLALS